MTIGFIPLISIPIQVISFFFFLNDTATPEIYTLPLHDALPIFVGAPGRLVRPARAPRPASGAAPGRAHRRHGALVGEPAPRAGRGARGYARSGDRARGSHRAGR